MGRTGFCGSKSLLLEKFSVGFSDFFGGAGNGDFALFEHDGTVTEAQDVIHGVSDEDDGLLTVEGGEIIITFFLEGGVADGKDFIEDEDIAFGTDSDRESEANLHTGRIIFELLVHEIFELGEFDDVVIHGGDFGIAEAKHGAIQVDVFAAGEFHIETDAKFDKGDEVAIDDDLATAGVIDAGENLEEGGLARAVATDDANEFAFFDVKTDVVKNLLVAVAFDATETIEDGLFETPGTLGGETEGLGKVTDGNGDITFGVVRLDVGADDTLAHLDFLRKEVRTTSEN